MPALNHLAPAFATRLIALTPARRHRACVTSLSRIFGHEPDTDCGRANAFFNWSAIRRALRALSLIGSAQRTFHCVEKCMSMLVRMIRTAQSKAVLMRSLRRTPTSWRNGNSLASVTIPAAALARKGPALRRQRNGNCRVSRESGMQARNKPSAGDHARERSTHRSNHADRREQTLSTALAETPQQPLPDRMRRGSAPVIDHGVEGHARKRRGCGENNPRESQRCARRPRAARRASARRDAHARKPLK